MSCSICFINLKYSRIENDDNKYLVHFYLRYYCNKKTIMLLI